MSHAVTVNTAELDALRLAVGGPVLEPGDPGYAEEVAGFVLGRAVAPAVVVGATSTADVAAAVRFAGRAGLRVGVQATGHGLTADLVDIVLVTTKRMAAVEVDATAATARAQAGVRWRAVIDAAAPHDLAPLNGSSSGVGVVGYTVGGGIGPLSRRYGLAADHVVRFTIVTADGVVRDVTPASEPDLFWAVRGGKGGFGIVTEIEFGLLPVARFYGGSLFFAAADAATVLHAWRTWTSTLPEEVSTSVMLLRLPPDPEVPEPLRGKFVVQVPYVHLGGAAEGESALAPLRAAAQPVLDLVEERPYVAVDEVYMDETTPMPVRDRGTALAELPAEAVDGLLAAVGPDVDVPLVLAEVALLGGAIARAPAVANAVAGRSAAFCVHTVGLLAGLPVEAVEKAMDAVIDAVAPWRSGALLNLLGEAEPEEVGRLWSAADRERLLAVARRYDPHSMFATNVVIG